MTQLGTCVVSTNPETSAFFALSDAEKLVDEAESETEVFTSTLLMLQQRLALARTTIEVLTSAVETLSPGSCLPLFRKARWPLPDTLSHLAADEEVDESIPDPPIPPPEAAHSPIAETQSAVPAALSPVHVAADQRESADDAPPANPSPVADVEEKDVVELFIPHGAGSVGALVGGSPPAAAPVAIDSCRQVSPSISANRDPRRRMRRT